MLSGRTELFGPGAGTNKRNKIRGAYRGDRMSERSHGIDDTECDLWYAPLHFPLISLFHLPFQTSSYTKVTFDYNAANEDELDLKVGQLIRVSTKENGGWWQGELDGKTGWFPDNFVEPVPCVGKTGFSGVASIENDIKTIEFQITSSYA